MLFMQLFLILRKSYRELNNTTEIYTWIIVLPTILTNGPLTVKFLADTGLKAGMFLKISRADVVKFILENLTDYTWLRKYPVITNKVRKVTIYDQDGTGIDEIIILNQGSRC